MAQKALFASECNLVAFDLPLIVNSEEKTVEEQFLLEDGYLVASWPN